MATKRKKNSELLRLAGLETRVRYGPERRALAELAATNKDTLDFSVHSAAGTAAGITQAIREASPVTKRVYGQAQGSLDNIYADAPTAPMGGLMQQVASRERDQAQAHVTEGRANALADLQQRKVGAQEGRAFQVQNALSTYRTDQAKVGRQMGALEGDAGAFRLGEFQKLMSAEDTRQLEVARLHIAQQAERRQRRSTEADITGIDPLTGRPTAIAKDRAQDNALARRKERRAAAKGGGGKGGPTAGAITKSQDIIGTIQDAREQAARLRKNGLRWGEVANALTLPKGEKTPYGGYGPKVSQAAVELARSGHLSPATMAALRARGLLPGRTPDPWRPGQSAGGHPSHGANPGNVRR